MNPEGDSVVSSKAPARVALRGFELAAEGAHMYEWLGRGPDFPAFLVRDIETELYAQDPGAQLLSLECLAKPALETRAVPRNDGTALANVVYFAATFPLAVRVTSSSRETWRLEVRQNYVMSNMDKAAERKLQIRFDIVAQAAG